MLDAVPDAMVVVDQRASVMELNREAESEPILRKLRGLGVGYAQGHAVAPPAPLVGKDREVALAHVQRSG